MTTHETPRPRPEVPKSAVAPGICLVVLNLLTLGGCVVGALWTTLVSELLAKSADRSPDVAEAAEVYARLDDSGLLWVFAGFSLLALIGSAFIAMRGSRGLAATGAVLSIVNLPGCCCCFANVAFGTWALVALLREPDAGS